MFVNDKHELHPGYTVIDSFKYPFSVLLRPISLIVKVLSHFID